MGKLFGYGRVSTADQNYELQLNDLKSYGCHPSDIYIDVMSSRSEKRPEFEKVKKLLEEGDTLVLWSLDRVGRSLVDLVNIMEHLNSMGCHLATINGNYVFDTRSALSVFRRKDSLFCADPSSNV